MADRAARRRHFRAGRNDSRDRRGLVIAEIQQRSDATFRLFDHGRQRELHIESAIAVATPARPAFGSRPNRFTDERTLLVSGPHFVLERIDLAPNSTWSPGGETRDLASRSERRMPLPDRSTLPWPMPFLPSRTASTYASVAPAWSGLVAYTGIGPIPHLLRRLAQPGSTDATRPQDDSGADFPHSSKGGLDQRPPGNNEMKHASSAWRSSAITFRGAAESRHLPMICIGRLQPLARISRPASLP